MADYKGIKGFKVQVLDSDPPSPIVGQVFYNSTTQILKGITAGTGAWASGGNLNTARMVGAGLGIQTASLFVAGETGSILGIVEQYNGSSWTEVGDINTARKANAASGTTAAGLTFGGASGPPAAEQAQTEVWNGSGWTEVNDLNTGRAGLGDASGATAALAMFGIATVLQQQQNLGMVHHGLNLMI